MFYFWSSGDKGEIWLSGDGIRSAFTRMYPEVPVCSDVVLLGERDLINVTFFQKPGISKAEKIAAENSFLDFVQKLGIKEVQAGWVNESPGGKPLSGTNLIRSPFFWGGIFWVGVAVLRMGFSGSILATIAGVSAFLFSALFTTQQGLEVRRWAKGLFERNA